MISTFETSLAMPSSTKFVPYIPQPPKSRLGFKAQSTSTTKAARPRRSEISCSPADEPWFHIDDFPMLNSNASHESVAFRGADASDLSVQEAGVVDSHEAAAFQVVSEHHQSGLGLLGEGRSCQIMESTDGSSQEFSPLLEGDIAQVGCSTTHGEPRAAEAEREENDHCTAAIHRPNSTEKHIYLNANGAHSLSEDIYQASPLAQDKPLLDDAGVLEGLSITRKRPCPSSIDTEVVPPAQLPDVTSKLRLEDLHLAKRRRSAEREVANVVLNSLPTPDVTPRPTPYNIDSCIAATDKPGPGFLDTGSQGGGGRSPAPSSNIAEEDNSDDGALTSRTAENLLQTPKRSLSQITESESCKESREDDQVHEVPSRNSTKTSRKNKRSGRQSSKKGRDLSRTSRRRRGASTITTRTSQDTASLQSYLSAPISSPKAKTKGRANRDRRPNANMAYPITDIAHYDVPEGSSIVTAIVHSDESSLALDMVALYHELFGREGEALRMTRLSTCSWMLLGYRYNAGTPEARSHRSWTPLNTEPMSNSHDDAEQSDEGRDGHEEDDDDEAYRPHAASNEQGYDSGTTRCHQYTYKPWSRSDEARLLSYKDKMAMEWKNIFKLFPDRSSGAVRTRWHMLRGSRSTATTS